ncbi:MAG: YdeI/OmpD-associated family protein, partial [Opitutus sp.]
NGFPFRSPLEPDGKAGHHLKVNKVMLDAADAAVGDMVAVEITRVGDEPATRVPADLHEALAAAPRARAMWDATTPSARRDWILWLSSGKLAETRALRIGKACSMLGGGKKRVCCFGGLGWLRKDHKAAGENWLPLPKG